MAVKKAQSGVSRRQLILVLGAGAVAEAVGRAAGVNPMPAQTSQDPCEKPAVVQRTTVTGPDRIPRKLLFSDLCCVIGGKSLNVGFNGLSKKEQDHIKPLIDAVNAAPLTEYSIFAFGLNEAQAKSLKSSLQNIK